MPERQNNLEDGHRISYTLKPTDLESAGKYGSPFWRLNHFFIFAHSTDTFPEGNYAISPRRHRPNGDFHPERDYWQKLCAPRAGMLHVPGIPLGFPTVAGPLRAS